MAAGILGQIEEAFAAVTREGGVSWRETDVLDGNGSMLQRLRARRQETDGTWQDVVTDPPWDHAWGSFSFLDAIGFRYYLPAAMVRTLQNPEDTSELFLDSYLTLDEGKLREHCLGKWSLLDARQRRCVAHFLQHMSDVYEPGYQGALASYWFQFLD